MLELTSGILGIYVVIPLSLKHSVIFKTQIDSV